MPIERGKTFVLKITDGIGGFDLVGKMRSNGFQGTRGTLEVTNKDSPAWDERLPVPFKSVTLSASGVYDGGTTQLAVRDAWLDNDDLPVAFQMVGASGDTWEGDFIVTDFSSDGEVKGERNWSVSLVSAGDVTVVDA